MKIASFFSFLSYLRIRKNKYFSYFPSFSFPFENINEKNYFIFLSFLPISFLLFSIHFREHNVKQQIPYNRGFTIAFNPHPYLAHNQSHSLTISIDQRLDVETRNSRTPLPIDKPSVYILLYLCWFFLYNHLFFPSIGLLSMLSCA